MASHTVASLQGREDLSALANSAREQLRTILREELRPLLASFVDKTADLLLKPASADHNPADTRKNSDLARKLKQNASIWCDTLQDQVEGRLFMVEDATGQRKLPEQNGSANASLIAVAKALLIAETRYFKKIAEIDARFNRVRLIMSLSVDNKAVAPTGLHQALEQTADKLDWPLAGRKVLYSSFEVHVIGNLERLYERMLQLFRNVGSEAAQMVVESTFDLSQIEDSAPAGQGQDAPKNWMQPPGEITDVDGKTAAMLTRLALENDGEGYTDGLLAADLLALMDKRPLPGISYESGLISVQRTSLAGHFLNEVKADPLLSRDMDAQHEPLRMPLVKSAIADNSVFTDASHPLASLIDEHMTKAARHRLVNAEEAQEMQDSLARVLEMFDLSPDFVRESMAKAEPLKDEQIERFYALQRKQAAQRREFVISEARRVVARELERSTFARDVPAPAKRFLEKAWSALLTQRLLKYGASNPIWQDGIDKTDQLIDLLEARDPAAKPPQEWVELIRSMIDELVKGGLPAEQRGNILKMLEAARKTP